MFKNIILAEIYFTQSKHKYSNNQSYRLLSSQASTSTVNSFSAWLLENRKIDKFTLVDKMKKEKRLLSSKATEASLETYRLLKSFLIVTGLPLIKCPLYTTP